MPDPDARSLKEDLRQYLRSSREALVWKLEGLSEYDVRRPLVPTGTNLLGLVKHVGCVELGYLGDTFGRPLAEPIAESIEDPEGNGDMWARPEESREEILGFFERVGGHSEETISSLPLDAEGTVPWWPEERARVTLGRIVLHVVAHTDRHAGHADIVRELIDGEAGFRKGTSNLPDLPEAWWREYYEKLEAAAREAEQIWG
jgi:uncharacterized damage-inducible protein DinB